MIINQAVKAEDLRLSGGSGELNAVIQDADISGNIADNVGGGVWAAGNQQQFDGQWNNKHIWQRGQSMAMEEEYTLIFRQER